MAWKRPQSQQQRIVSPVARAQGPSPSRGTAVHDHAGVVAILQRRLLVEPAQETETEGLLLRELLADAECSGAVEYQLEATDLDGLSHGSQ